jgi:hypothetical protein
LWQPQGSIALPTGYLGIAIQAVGRFANRVGGLSTGGCRNRGFARIVTHTGRRHLAGSRGTAHADIVGVGLLVDADTIEIYGQRIRL